METILINIIATLFYVAAGCGLLGCFYGMYMAITGQYNDPNDPGPK